MVSSQCEGCQSHVELVDIANDNYCNKHRVWLNVVKECNNIGAESHKPRDKTG